MISLFIVEDEPTYALVIRKKLEEIEDINIQVFHSAEDCMSNLHLNPDIITTDFNLPDANGLDILKKVKSYNDNIQVVLISGQKEVEVVVKAYKDGASDYIIKDENTFVELANTIKKLCKTIHLKEEVERLKEQIIDRNKYSNIIGDSHAILKTLKLIQKVEKSNMMVLITGESGTGKELVSKALHYNSPRNRKPFIAVNVGAIPEDLIENELFGHEKGAFTDANERRTGKFEDANEGTIFLDEIGEMNMSMQIKLLRVLEEKEIVRVGGNKTIKLDVRVIAATNKNLAVEVKAGRFREDLFYRLQGFLIQLPPLRERENDVLLLATYFLDQFGKFHNNRKYTISKDAAKQLMDYKWPGNVRELKSTIERASLLADDNVITPDELIFST